MPLPIITKITSKGEFLNLIKNNPGVFIVKFGATWCGPCKKIEKLVEEHMNSMPDNVQCAIVDVDECMEVYGFLRTKKMIKTIPALLGYYQDNESYIPDEFMNSSQNEDVNYFFETCLEKANE